MIRIIDYRSSMAAYFNEYHEWRVSLGYRSEDTKYTFSQLDQFLQSIDYKQDTLTEEAYNQWVESMDHLKSTTKYLRQITYIKFAKYMNHKGVECYVPYMPRPQKSHIEQYIYSEEEIATIFKAADTIRVQSKPASQIAISIPALIRTLYSTAMRISEALNLNNRDIDFERHVIVINDPKNHHQRYAPINESLEAVLKQYIFYRDKIRKDDIAHPDSAFFVASDGHRLNRTTPYIRFQSILAEAGIPFKGSKEGPHIHHLRHTACVHAFMHMRKAGYDMYCSLPMLSTFMGHRGIYDTERYLRLTEEMYPEIMEMDAQNTAIIKEYVNQVLNYLCNETRV